MVRDFVRSVREASGLLLLVSASVGCRQTHEQRSSEAGFSVASSAKPEATPVPSASAHPAGLTWIDPPGLRRVPATSPAYKASYVLPRATGDGEDGELVVFHSGPGQAGSDDSTLEHWVSQFSAISSSDVKRTERESNGVHEQTVEIQHGTFDGGPSTTGPKKDYALEGARAEGPSGDYAFKMTGPARTVAAGRAAFMQLLDSVHVVHPDH